MTINKTKNFAKRTKFYIVEPASCGKSDKNRTVTVDYDPEEILKIPRITREEIRNLPNTHEEHEEAETFEVPEIGIVVFINSFDTECGSWKYRKGAHDTRGPYLLKE